MQNIWFAVLVLLLAPSAWAGAVYKCKSQNGELIYQATPCPAEAQPVSSWQSRGDGVSGGGTLVISQGQGGHYFIDGAINGNFLNFIIDTGATTVTIPLGMAKDAGLKCQQMALMQTANGTSRACTTTIDKLTFGGFTLQGVEATVVPNLAQPLLGMNVLKRFRVEQDGGQMRLSKNY